MVRQWTYINSTHTKYNVFSTIVDSYQFKVFRKNVRFKKFKKYNLTIFVRKRYIKRKQLRNFIANYYIMRNWVFFYLKYGQINRFFQNLYFFNKTLYLPNVTLLLNKITNQNFINININTLVLKNLRKTFYNLNNNLTLLQLNSDYNLLFLKNLNLNLYIYGKDFFKINTLFSKIVTSVSYFTLVRNLVVLRKILIKITLFNIFFILNNNNLWI